MPARAERKAKWLCQGLGAVLGVAVALLIVEFLQQPLVQDTWRGLWYEPNEKVQLIEDDLLLTGTGKRIFAATHPTLEDKDSFNEHCESYNREVSLLGCYVDGEIHVYEITREGLTDSNKVTMAHELLHAVWERTSAGEKEKIKKLLEGVRQENEAWFEEELKTYTDESKLEEIWTRAGTKLRDLPEELERAYAKYFQNRMQIVEFYENYQAPFKELQARNEKLKAEILAAKDQITLEREAYLAAMTELDEAIDKFNECADETGCFTADEFQHERERLVSERERLEQVREELNMRIEKNNAKVAEYQENQLALGELADAMNSKVEGIEEKK